MTPLDAAKILELSADATPEQIEARFLDLRRKLEDRIAKAPTPGLQAKYRASLAEVTEAFETLTLAADSSALPVLRKEESGARSQESGRGNPESAGPSPNRESSIEHRKSPAAKSSREFAIVSILALAVLGIGGWWVLKTRTANAEKARIAAEAKAEGERKAAEARAEADRNAELARQAAEAKKLRLAEEQRLAAEERARQQATAEAERVRLDQLATQVRVQLAEARLLWEAAEREEREAERALNDLKSEQRSLRDASAGRQAELAARVGAQQAYFEWVRDHLFNHPARRLRIRAEELLSARQADDAAKELAQLKIALGPIPNEIAASRKRLLTTEGSLQVSSDPAGLAWELTDAFGRTQRGITPATVDRVALGSAELVFRRPGWPEKRQTAVVQRESTAQVATEFIPGGWEIVSSPAGAEIHVTETEGARTRLLGTTPHRMTEVQPGRYGFEIRLKGYNTVLRQITVTARQSIREEVNLDKVSPRTATKDNAWANSLDQWFVPVKGTDVLFCIWETREADYAAFVRETKWPWSSANAGATHPVRNLTWDDAQAFCAWLTRKERATGKIGPNERYRLPTVAEWTAAVGPDSYPYGNNWPPPQGAGNYGSGLRRDSFDRTAPVGSFKPNLHGLYDMGGNVWELTEEKKDGNLPIIRGGSFDSDAVLSSFQTRSPVWRGETGFRVVLDLGR